MKHLIKTLLITMSIFIAIDSFAHGSHPVNSKRLCEASQEIFYGTTTSRKSEWIDKALYTITEVNIIQSVKGEQTETIKIITRGGVDYKRKFPVAVANSGTKLPLTAQAVWFVKPSNVKPGFYEPVDTIFGSVAITDGGKTLNENAFSAARAPVEQLMDHINESINANNI